MFQLAISRVAEFWDKVFVSSSCCRFILSRFGKTENPDLCQVSNTVIKSSMFEEQDLIRGHICS